MEALLLNGGSFTKFQLLGWILKLIRSPGFDCVHAQYFTFDLMPCIIKNHHEHGARLWAKDSEFIMFGWYYVTVFYFINAKTCSTG